MAAPKIAFTVEPFLSNAFRYLRLAPSRPGEGERFQLSFQTVFTNNEPTSVHITTLRVTFPNEPALGQHDIPIKTLHPDLTSTNGLDVPSGATVAPMDFTQNDNIVLVQTPPPLIRFDLFANGFSQPATVTSFMGPVEGPAYRWMAQAHELKRGEYWKGIAAKHCCGPQLYALDLGVEYFDSTTKKWSMLHPGLTDTSKNENFRIWGKPIHAMADGIVASFANNIPTNTNPPNNAPGANTEGNHFYLQHGNERMLYAHMQPGSLNSALLHTGAVVHAGDFLGLAGNSGNSSAPHLHIHAVDVTTGMLRPIPWVQKMVAAQHATGADDGDWVLSQAQGLAVVNTLIYPGGAMPADPKEWSEWSSLGGQLIFGPCVSSWDEDRLDVFVVGTDKALYHRFWNGAHWSGWENLGGELTSKPAAVSWGPHRIDVFGRGTDNGLYHKWWDGSQWHGWQGLGGTLASGPTVSSRHANHLDVFAAFTDQALHHRIWKGTSWSDWESLGGTLTADPAAVSWDDHRIDVFVRATDETIYHKWWDGSAWSGWEPQERPMLFGAAVSSRGENRLDVFLVARDGTLEHRIWNGAKWTRWESLGGLLTADPAAVSWSSDRIDVFGRGTDNALYHTYWKPS